MADQDSLAGIACFPVAQDLEAKLKGATVILPAVTYANVGELAVDVLVSSLRSSLAARLESPDVLPCIGNDAYTLEQPGSMTTPLELFHLQGSSIFLLQQRAPAMTGRQAAFATSLAAWLQAAGVASVIVLCGMDATLRRDRQLESGLASTRYLCSRTSGASTAAGEADALVVGVGAKATCQTLGWIPLESEFLDEEKQLHHLLQPWPLLSQLEAVGIPALLLCCFALEGDNGPDGMRVAQCVLAYLARAGVGLAGAPGAGPDGGEVQLRTPCSWVCMYGRSLPQEIF